MSWGFFMGGVVLFCFVLHEPFELVLAHNEKRKNHKMSLNTTIQKIPKNVIKNWNIKLKYLSDNKSVVNHSTHGNCLS